MNPLTHDEIQAFIEQGFVKVDNAFPPASVAACQAILWEKTGCLATDPSTWHEPVIRMPELSDEPFRRAANTSLLHEVYNQLAGPGAWLPPSAMGSFVLRFPSRSSAPDTGWHVDAAFPGANADDYMQWRINIASKGRALLMLFLFSDVGSNDAPTRIQVGSHKKVAEILAAHGENGLSFMELAAKLDETETCQEVIATGSAGTVFLCHPFLVHAAQDHHGIVPKFMAQPALYWKAERGTDHPIAGKSPVAQAIKQALR